MRTQEDIWKKYSIKNIQSYHKIWWTQNLFHSPSYWICSQISHWNFGFGTSHLERVVICCNYTDTYFQGGRVQYIYNVTLLCITRSILFYHAQFRLAFYHVNETTTPASLTIPLGKSQTKRPLYQQMNGAYVIFSKPFFPYWHTNTCMFRFRFKGLDHTQSFCRTIMFASCYIAGFLK